MRSDLDSSSSITSSQTRVTTSPDWWKERRGYQRSRVGSRSNTEELDEIVHSLQEEVTSAGKREVHQGQVAQGSQPRGRKSWSRGSVDDPRLPSGN